MNDLLPFLIVGITTGSVYGLAAIGLVVTYKTSGIFNFAHGAIAAVSAFGFYQLNVVWGLGKIPSLLIAVGVLPPLLAVVMERIARGLATATATGKIVAAVGLQLAITSALIAHFGAAGLNFPTFLPTDTVSVAGVNLGADQLISLGVAVLGAVSLFVFFRISPLGVRMRAVVDNPELLALNGSSPFAVRSWAWLIGTWFAGLSGVLLAPNIGLDALLLTLLVVQAYGAAAVGLFSSLPLTFVGGLLVGVLAALATKFTSGSEVLSGLPPAVPFLVLFLVLLVVPRHKLVSSDSRGAVGALRPKMTARGSMWLSLAAIVIAMYLPFLVGPKLPVYSQALVFVVIFGSLDLLVRTSGQVSLLHAGFVAVGSATFAHFSVDAGMPWLVAVLLAGLVTVPVGALVAIPAIRLSGLFLALATFGFGLLLERLLYPTGSMFGATGNLPAPRPAGLTTDRSFYYVLLAFAVVGSLVLVLIRRSRLGSLLRALAESPTTLSTLGLGVNVIRVSVFSISALLAGVGGALLAAQGQSASGTQLTAFTSLTWLAVLALNGPTRSAAPVLASIGLVVVPAYIDNDTINLWLPALFGVSAVLVSIHEASAKRRGGTQQTELQPAVDRGAERLSGRSPVRQRWAEARAVVAAAPRAARPRVLLRGSER